MTQKPYLNLGAGRVILPGEKPAHHVLVDDAIYTYPLYWNVDRNMQPGIDCVTDLFTYPWPFEDNSFDAALLTHLVEHIPHEIRIDRTRRITGYTDEQTAERIEVLENCQDGWYSMFAELYRVLTPDAIAHILCPYGWSNGAITDPTHTRLITEHTFTHSMSPDPNSPFEYSTGGLHFEMEGNPRFGGTGLFPLEDSAELMRALQTRINVAHEIYVKLRVVK